MDVVIHSKDQRPRQKINIISICSGIGGLDLGVTRALRRLGFEPCTICYVEGEAFAAACLVKKMEAGELDEAPIWSDLKTFDCKPWRGRVGLVVGGYPCQPFSLAGRREGKEDPRHLWPYVLQVLTGTGASLLFCENVRGHVSKGLGEVLGSLSCFGFDAEWDVFSAEEEGAPHRRERLFAMAYSSGARQSLPDRVARIEGRGPPETRSKGIQDGQERRTNKYNAIAFDASPTLAYASSERESQPQRVVPSKRGWAGNSRKEVTHADHPGRPQQRGTSPGNKEHPTPKLSGGWPSEPNVGRVANGIPHRVDRLRALGNAVVPQCAERAFLELFSRAATQ